MWSIPKGPNVARKVKFRDWACVLTRSLPALPFWRAFFGFRGLVQLVDGNEKPILQGTLVNQLLKWPKIVGRSIRPYPGISSSRFGLYCPIFLEWASTVINSIGDNAGTVCQSTLIAVLPRSEQKQVYWRQDSEWIHCILFWKYPMIDPKITCPNCKTEIKLTESLAAPLVESTRLQYEKRIADKDADVAKREAAIKEQEIAIAKAKEAINDEIAEKLKAERKTIAAEEAKKAKTLIGADLDQKAKEVADLQEVLKQRDEKLAEAQKAQVDLIRKQRELDDAKREMDLTIEKRIQESLATTREQAKKEAEDGLKLKVAEKEQTINSMQKQIEELKRRAEQGSQQLQGEVQEIELEETLRMKFPRDLIEPVPKGEFGGDALHRVYGQLQQVCGTILWESKRTKSWSDGWLSKLREDQRAAKAELAVIVSHTLPKEVDSFDLVDGIWGHLHGMYYQ